MLGLIRKPLANIFGHTYAFIGTVTIRQRNNPTLLGKLKSLSIFLINQRFKRLTVPSFSYYGPKLTFSISLSIHANFLPSILREAKTVVRLIFGTTSLRLYVTFS